MMGQRQISGSVSALPAHNRGAPWTHMRGMWVLRTNGTYALADQDHNLFSLYFVYAQNVTLMAWNSLMKEVLTSPILELWHSLTLVASNRKCPLRGWEDGGHARVPKLEKSSLLMSI